MIETPASVALIALGGVIAVAAVAAAYDLGYRLIPDRLVVATAALGLTGQAALYGAQGAAGAVAGAGAVLLLMLVLWRWGLIGGGDAKFLSAGALALPVEALPDLLLTVAAAGGLLALAYLGAHAVARIGMASRLVRPAGRSRSRPLRLWRAELRRVRRRCAIPYGVAIAVGLARVLTKSAGAPAGVSGACSALWSSPSCLPPSRPSAASR